MYTYNSLLDDVSYLAHYMIDTGSIGESELSRVIPYIHAGSFDGPQIFITGGIHAREHITSFLIIRQTYALYNSYKMQGIKGGGIYFIPCLNPDGNMLCAEGLKSAPKERHEFLKSINNGSGDFSLYKANVNGVDLNTNFDARFGGGKYNVFQPASENYVGEKPFSEKETQALRDFTLKIMPKATVSYHALGREIYYEFGQNEEEKQRDKNIAKELNKHLDYKIIGDSGDSTGGYKDYCISHLKIPSFTIEIIPDKFSHPLTDLEIAEDDIKRNINLPVNLLNLIMK